MNAMIPLKDFAKLHGVSVRTVHNWIAANKVQGVKDPSGAWMFSADAPAPSAAADTIVLGEANPPAQGGHFGQAVAIPTASAVAPAWLDFEVPPPVPGKSWVETALDQLPVYVPVGTAARLLGVSEYAIVHNADEFGAVKRGANGGWVIPQRQIRSELGLC